MSSLDKNLSRPILADPGCGRGPRTIESISKLLFSIWKPIDFQGFLGIETFFRKKSMDVSREKIDFRVFP